LVGPPNCDIGFVFALGIESGCLEDRFANSSVVHAAGRRVRVGELAGHRIALVRTGMGQVAARRGTEHLLAGHRPKLVISAGFSGGLQPQVRRGDLVLADRVGLTSGERLLVDLRFEQSASARPRVHVGTIVTVDQLVCLPAEKISLGREQSALAVDMESWAVADACRQAKVPFLAVRVISDAADEALPAFIDQMARRKGFAGKTGVVLGALWRRPGSLREMVRLRSEGLVQADQLARFLVRLVGQISPAS
jgi:adenosylhomocysteine nucleosidase